MAWIFWAIAGAAVVHLAEEYVFPGGFHRPAHEQLALGRADLRTARRSRSASARRSTCRVR